jgi:hypothetical protein
MGASCTARLHAWAVYARGVTPSTEKYVAISTAGGDGAPGCAPVWVVPVSDGRAGCWSAPGGTPLAPFDGPVLLQPCDGHGRVRPGAAAVPGTAETVRSGRLFEEVQGRVGAKYGPAARLGRLRARLRRGGYAEVAVLVRLDG